MANVRFITTGNNKGRKALAATTYPILINGNGAYSGAPALVQDADFPMSNALLVDRSAAIWVTGPTPDNDPLNSDLIIELHIGPTPLSIVAAGVLGFSFGPGTLFPLSYLIEYLPGATYSTSGWVSDIPAVSTQGGRDSGAVFSPRTAKFWRFRFSSAGLGANGFSVGSFFIATTVTDLGFLYSRATETLVQPQLLVEGYGHTPFISHTGLSFRRWALSYDNNDTTTRGLFDNLGYSPVGSTPIPFVFLSPENGVYECVQDGEEFVREHIWAPPDRWRFTFPMRSLP